MTEIKVCGITNPEDAIAAVESGAHALGFIFYRKSPRYVSPENAAEIIRNLPERVTKVGVFVNHDSEEVKEVADYCLLDMIQLHGDETPEYAGELSEYAVIKAVALRSEDDVSGLKRYPVRAILVDAYDPRLYGGTGKTAHWEAALRIKEEYPLILSGGLHAGNIEEALRRVSPQAVDVNSGCEQVPGKKDHDKMRKIIEIVQRFDADCGTKSAVIFGKVKRTVLTGSGT
jgi:phosphoribosylanthranilate isomerase